MNDVVAVVDFVVQIVDAMFLVVVVVVVVVRGIGVDIGCDVFAGGGGEL